MKPWGPLCALALGTLATVASAASPLPMRVEVVDLENRPVAWFAPATKVELRFGFAVGSLSGPWEEPAFLVEPVRVGETLRLDEGAIVRRAQALAAPVDPKRIEQGLVVEPKETRIARLGHAVRIDEAEELATPTLFLDKEKRASVDLVYFDRPCRLSGTVRDGDVRHEYDLVIESPGLHRVLTPTVAKNHVRIRAAEAASELAFAIRLTERVKEKARDATDPARVHTPQPAYPESARLAEIDGRVVVWTYIDRKGDVIALVIRQSPHELLSRAVVSTLQTWKFTPAMKDEKPVASIGEFDIRFQFRDAET